MKIFIQQNVGGPYWSHQDGWVRTQSAATIYNGVVAAVDALVHDHIGDADILMTFGAVAFDARLQSRASAFLVR